MWSPAAHRNGIQTRLINKRLKCCAQNGQIFLGVIRGIPQIAGFQQFLCKEFDILTVLVNLLKFCEDLSKVKGFYITS